MSWHSGKVGSSKISLASPRKWFWTIVPIALALSFVSGAFIAIDSTQMAVVRAQVDEVPVDFIGRGTTTDALDEQFFISTRIEYMSTLDGVEKIEPLVIIDYVLVKNSIGEVAPYYTGGHMPVMFMPSGDDRMMESYKISGDLPAQGMIALPKQLADDLDMSVGDTATLTFAALAEEMSFSFEVSDIWTQEDMKNQTIFMPDGGSMQYLDLDPRAVMFREYLNPVVLNLQDLYPLVNSLGLASLREKYVETYSESLYLIWIDRGRYIDYADTGESVEQLDALWGPMSSRYLAYGVSVQRSDLVWAIGPWSVGDLNEFRLRYLGYSMPVLALGIYVAAVGAGIGTDFREDSIQMLLSQGVRRRSVLKRLGSESIVVGLIAGGVGLLLGILVSRAVLDPVVADVAGSSVSVVSSSDYGVTLLTVLAMLGLALLVVAVAWFFASLRATKPPRTTPSELDALRVLPIAEVILIGLSMISIIAILGGQKWVGSHGFDWYLHSPGTFINNIGLVIFPAVPFMLSLGLVSLLTRWPVSLHHRLMRRLSSTNEPVVAQLGPMAERCDRRARRTCVVVTLALAFGMFVTIATSTAESESISEFMYAEFIALMAVVLAGAAMASYANSRIVMSALASDGASDMKRASAARTLLSESSVLTFIAIVIGTSVGLATAYLFGMMWVPGQDIEDEFGMVLTPIVALVVFTSIVAILLSSMIASYLGARVPRLKLAAQ